MAKELMEIGGFITEGAEIVNHDASLSGNGTVDSPLGVVPGYNETVLWSGSQNVIGSTDTQLTLSESASNFEKLRIYFMGSAQNDAETSLDIIMISRTDAYYTLSVAYTNNNSGVLYVDACSVQIDGTAFKVARGFRKEITTSITNTNSRGPTILKIIGINRIAGGN